MLIDHSSYKDKKLVKSDSVFKLLQHVRSDLQPFELDKEYFYSIGLTRSNTIRYLDLISVGSLTATIAEPREIFRMAIHKAVGGIIIAHNHPSGNLIPSEADKKLTKNIKDAGNIIRIPLIDHIIFSEDGFYSFADEGLL